MTRKLTVKQKKFADEYIKTGNAYQSAIKAGYSENYAKGNIIKLLENERVKTYLDKQMQKIEDKKIAKAEEVLTYLTSIMRGKHTEEVLRGVGKGNQVIDHMEVSAKDRIKAAELLGKRYSLFKDNVNISGDVGVQIIDDIGSVEDED